MTYGCETWTLTNRDKQHLRIFERIIIIIIIIINILNYALQPLRLILRSGLDFKLSPPGVSTRHHTRAPSGGRWNCGREMSGNFA
jgi:hypothetical protein